MIKFKLEERKGKFIGEDEFYREVKLLASPNSEIKMDGFALGMTIIGTGQKHEEHVHLNNKETILLYEGEGIMVSQGKEIPVFKGDVIGFNCKESHGFINTGDCDLKILWIYAPLGKAEENFLLERK